MKATGIVRQVDNLGRVVMPIELRRGMEINVKDPLEIYVDGEFIVLKKYIPMCIICGGDEDLIEFRGKKVCRRCIAELLEE